MHASHDVIGRPVMDSVVAKGRAAGRSFEVCVEKSTLTLLVARNDVQPTRVSPALRNW